MTSPWERAAAGRLQDRVRREAAGQRVPSTRPSTRPVAGISADRDVKRARKSLAAARAANQAAVQAAAAPPGGPQEKVNTADPSSHAPPRRDAGRQERTKNS